MWPLPFVLIIILWNKNYTRVISRTKEVKGLSFVLKLEFNPKVNVETYVEKTFIGNDNIEDTEPVNNVRYIRQAVNGTTPNHAKATRV